MTVEERDALVAEIVGLTRKMRQSMHRTETLGQQRRALLLRVNRESLLTFTHLEHLTGLSRARLTAEVRKAKEEAGVTEQHPRYPAFGRNGSR